jgi:glycosyltransferase involved in cell wall biosynthesis
MVWIHNIHGAFKWGWGAELVEEACRHGQVLWTLHDMWPLGSGHYYFPEEQLPFEYSQSLLGKLTEEVAGKRLILTTPSIWLKQLIESQCGNYTSLRMPYFLDTDVFQPAYREQMRRHLGLKKDDFLFLSAAEDLNDPRKGISLLCEAWEKMGDWIAKNNVSLGLLGRNGHHFECPSSRIFSYGNQQNEADVASYMAASDLFIHPSSADNFPLVLEESQACGTPVMAFQVGGVSEAFENNETGFLIKSRDTKSLMDSINNVVKNRQVLLKMRTRARKNMKLKHKKSAFFGQWQVALKKIKENEIIK